MIIPEAPEREELTVQDMVENKDSGILYPLKPKEALDSYSSYLTDFEKTEILEFEDIFYLSPTTSKYQPTKSERLINNGFDDNDGYYRL